MTTENHKEDEQWLAALAGSPDADASPKLNAQANILRQALQRNKKKIDETIPAPNDAEFQRLRQRLQQDGLIEETTIHRKESRPISAVLSWLWSTPQVLGFAAALVMGIGIGFVMQEPHEAMQTEEGLLTVRGNDQATILIVDDPLARAIELRDGLIMAGGKPELRIEGKHIVIFVKQTNAVIDYFMAQRIQAPKVKDGVISIVIENRKQPPSHP